MNHIPRFFRVSGLLLIVLLVGQSTVSAQTADAVFSRLKEKYESITGLRASFTQTMQSAFLDDAESFSGSIVLQGDQYRIETGSEVLVVTEDATYVYRPSEQQVLINDIVEDEASFSPNDFLLHYDERYTITEVHEEMLDGERHIRIDLTPKREDSFFLEATLWMRDADAIITRVSVLDVNETRMVFSLNDIELNPTLDPNTFSFTPPDGVEVIDLRS